MRSLVITLVTFSALTSAQLGLAVDPVVVVYSDPSLTRLEKEIGVTPAQKDRFDDIVVKYRDPESSNAAGPKAGADADSSATPQAGGRGGGGGGRGRGGGGGGAGGGGGRGGTAFTGAKGNNLREELDELATVLTPDQLKKFKELNQRKKKAPRSAS
jgi:uncharacterized membrane protein YgcG